MKVCSVCVLPETFPGISFDEKGVCNQCRSVKDNESFSEDRKEYRRKFEELVASCSGKGEYDCTVAFSGGKDSTYTLYVLRKVFNLKVLALTFDNGFISDQAFRNIRTTAEALEADSIIFKADFTLLKKIFNAGVQRPLYAAKTLERASTICTSCIGLAKFILLRFALEKNIPMMAWGWTPGQAPMRSSIMKMNPMLFKANQEALRKPMVEAAGDGVNRYFLTDDHFRHSEFPYSVSPLAFMDYSESQIFETIKEFGWISPKEVDSNSTNCLLNSFANNFHISKYGFHPYAFEIAGMVRCGVMSRDEGLKKLEEAGNPETEKFVRSKLGL